MSRMTSNLALLIVFVLIAVPAHADENDAQIAQRCPGVAAWKKAHPELSEKNQVKRVAVGKPTQPQLRRQLLDMFKADKEARTAWIDAGMKTDDGSDPTARKVMAVDARNLKKLKSVIERQGFPGPAQVGVDGVDAAFILVQHADRDPIFQMKVLPQLEVMRKQGLVSGQQLALLTDRTLRAQGKPQRYGTQFVGNDKTSEMRLQPVEDMASLDERRAGMGMPPLVDYACILSVVTHKSVKPEP